MFQLQELHEKFEHKEQQIAKLNIEVTSNRNELQQLYSNYGTMLSVYL